MTDREILIELLAIKLFEHAPMADGLPNRLSWSEADPEDRQFWRDLITTARQAEDLYKKDA